MGTDPARAAALAARSVHESSVLELSKITALLEARLIDLSEAVADGHVTLRGTSVIIPKPRAGEIDPKIVFSRRTIFGRGLAGQLPDVIIGIDARTRFSWILLGRCPRPESELINLYCALVALGTDLSAADLVRMVPQAAADSIAQMMVRLEAKDAMDTANQQVLEFMRGYNVTRLWGPGIAASADMMSLDARRQLWSARTEPRRKGYAVGTYAHVLDQWGIIYNQPIILNKRQADAAIEGALKQRIIDIDRVAVDTHGFTHFGMAFAKILGSDVSGQVTASVIMWQLAAYPRQNGVATALREFGRLERTLFTLDWLEDPSLRRQTTQELNKGEARNSLAGAFFLHRLREIRDRTYENQQYRASGLNLLVTAIILWNTRYLEKAVGELRAHGEIIDDAILAHLSLLGWEHINLTGDYIWHDAAEIAQRPDGTRALRNVHSRPRIIRSAA